MSPWQLRGEPSRASTVWLSAGDQTSLGGVSRLFSRSSQFTFTFITQNCADCKGKNGISAHTQTKREEKLPLWPGKIANAALYPV